MLDSNELESRTRLWPEFTTCWAAEESRTVVERTLQDALEFGSWSF